MLLTRRAGMLAVCCAGLIAPLLAAPSPASASTPFSRISEIGIGDRAEQPTIAKFGNTYEVAWVHISGTSTKTYSIKARILNAAGATVGSVINVLQGWALIRDFPTILSANGTRVIAFNGTQTSGGVGPDDNPAEYYLTSTNGTTWTLAAGYLSPKVDPVGADGTVVALGASSMLTALGTADHVSYQSGASASLPVAWTGTTSPTGNFTSYPGVATSGANTAWISWLSDSNSASGIHVQPVLPSLGTRKRAPSSLVNGAYPPTHQRVPLVVRSGTTGPPYTAYARPDGLRVFVWKYGATSPMTLSSAGGANNVTLTAGPGGRLWVFWTDSKGWHATRSNKAATRFGPVTTIGYPANADHTTIDAVGSAGPLEAVSLTIPGFTMANAAIYAAQIKPRLSCSASPTSGKPGTRIAISVRDAGDAVSGATVHFAGKTGTTSSTGVAHFTIPSGSPTTLTATAGHSGYTGCSTKVKRL